MIAAGDLTKFVNDKAASKVAPLKFAPIDLTGVSVTFNTGSIGLTLDLNDVDALSCFLLSGLLGQFGIILPSGRCPSSSRSTRACPI